MKVRKRLAPQQAQLLGLEIKEKKKDNRNPRYTITLEDWEKVRDTRKMIKTSARFDKDGVKMGWVEKLQDLPIDIDYDRFEIYEVSTNPTSGQEWIKQRLKRDIPSEFDNKYLASVIKKHIKPVATPTIKANSLNDVVRLVYSDVHIGMETDERGSALYGSKWTRKEQLKSVDKMVQSVLEQKGSADLLIIDDLGDFLDGWDKKTTRKGHDLPQNMTNKEMFEVGLEFKVYMIQQLVPHFSEIRVNNITEDNHSGEFGYIVNSAFKQIVELQYENIKVTNYEQFINHYYVGKHAFVISHGKDSHALRFGFKPFLDSRQIEKIDHYLKHHKVYNKADFIEFSKGDSHQMLFDYSTSSDFNYFNYPSLAPPSEWVQTNFKKSEPAYVIQTFNSKKKPICVLPLFV